MAHLNDVNLIGNITRDPETKFLPSGDPVCDFSIAVNRKYTTKSGEKCEDVLFLDVTAFAGTAKFIGEYGKKGASVYVGGSLREDRWDDKTTGQKRSKIKIVADNIQLLGSSQGNGGQSSARQPAGATQAPVDPDADDSSIPF